MTRKEVISLAILLLVLSYGLYRYITRSYTAEKSRYLMDTIVKISATSKSKDVNKKVDMVFDFIKSLEATLSEHKEGSWLWNVNHSNKFRHDMNPHAYQILLLADSLYKLTAGKFDITVKPVFDLWQFSSENPQIPDSMLIKETLKKVGFDKIRFNESTLYLPKGMQLTFGALAKGYIVDKAREYMLSLDLPRGFINCRSSMTFYGEGMLPAIVGIQHPRMMNEVIATIQAKNISIGTSGDYQQFFEANNKRYHHILDATTGYPVSNVYSITVLSPSAMFADGISTALFQLSPKKAIEYVKSIPNTDAIIYYQQNGDIMALKSQGIKRILQSERTR